MPSRRKGINAELKEQAPSNSRLESFAKALQMGQQVAGMMGQAADLFKPPEPQVYSYQTKTPYLENLNLQFEDPGMRPTNFFTATGQTARFDDPLNMRRTNPAYAKIDPGLLRRG